MKVMILFWLPNIPTLRTNKTAVLSLRPFELLRKSPVS